MVFVSSAISHEDLRYMLPGFFFPEGGTLALVVGPLALFMNLELLSAVLCTI